MGVCLYGWVMGGTVQLPGRGEMVEWIGWEVGVEVAMCVCLGGRGEGPRWCD